MGKWARFWLVCLIWGSSYLLIRVGVQELSPYQLVFIRTGIAALGLFITFTAMGKRLPTRRDVIIPIILIGLGNTAIPFILISWGEQSVESGLASVLQATTPIFGMVIAHFTFADEHINWQRILGIALGFIGVGVLASRGASGNPDESSVVGQLAIVLASAFYGAFTVYSRKTINNRVEPLVIATGGQIAAAIFSGALMLIAPLLGGQAPTPIDQLSRDALGAAIVLGVFNTFFAYLIYYSVVRDLGVTRTQMITYVLPVIGLTLGALFGEQVDARLIIGAALIFSGLGAINLHRPRRRAAQTTA